MLSKPFKPLTIRRPQLPYSTDIIVTPEPPSKKRRINNSEPSYGSLHSIQLSNRAETVNPLRKPVTSVEDTLLTSTAEIEATRSASEYFSVLWRNFTLKKNKTWDDDGVLTVRNGRCILHDSSGNILGRSTCSTVLCSGVIISIGGKEIEIVNTITETEFELIAQSKSKLEVNGSSDAQSVLKDSSKQHMGQPTSGNVQTPLINLQFKQIQVAKPVISKPSGYPLHRNQNEPFRQPLKETTILPQIPSETPIPRHDPNSPDAVVFKRPNKVPNGCQIVDVVLDPLIGRNLRDHQREGVKFMYECVMGLRNFDGQGCILADDMGLGKTLQAIALLWTLLKQNPIHKAPPVAKKALIVCPVSLIKNWKKEFRKWLGSDRLGVLEYEDQKTRLSMFDGKAFNVMIIGYERLRMIAEDLARGTGIDIVICDEGHRLKTIKNKSAKAIESLNTPRRVILSGTPIQNDLGEFYAMVNFVNDGSLGSQKGFLKHFEGPIMRSRQPSASQEMIENGEAASEELSQITSPFILRRTTEILAKFLPRKTEYVLFCQPTSEQASIYRHVIGSPMFQSALGSNDTALQLISVLKKLCNSPALMRSRSDIAESTNPSYLATLNDMLPSSLSKYYQNASSAKIRILDQLLQHIRRTTEEKVVLVSNYTSTLDLMENLLLNSGFTYSRLDGNVQANKRQGLVDSFNRAKASSIFAFLLSAKAGGVGINLTGASRLVLFDVDWNPATDDQAMARIYRQGQKSHCRIYRFLVKGGLEERIWQRQIVKRGLADSIMENGGAPSTAKGTMTLTKAKNGKATFSQEELRDLFRFDESESLRTHDLIGCDCFESVSETASADSAQELPTKDMLESEDLATSFPDITEPISASKLLSITIDEQERRIRGGRHPKQRNRESKGDEIQELMLYSHLDTRRLPEWDFDSLELEEMESAIDDPCLLSVLRQQRKNLACGVSYIFKKTIGPVIEDTDTTISEG